MLKIGILSCCLQIHTSLINGRPSADDLSPRLLEFTSARYIRLRLQRIRTLNADLMTLSHRDPKDLDPIVTRRVSTRWHLGHCEKCFRDIIVSSFLFSSSRLAFSSASSHIICQTWSKVVVGFAAKTATCQSSGSVTHFQTCNVSIHFGVTWCMCMSCHLVKLTCVPLITRVDFELVHIGSHVFVHFLVGLPISLLLSYKRSSCVLRISLLSDLCMLRIASLCLEFAYSRF
jgi:hypothetical protein